MGSETPADYRAARGFARAAQVASWLLAFAWSAIIIVSSGLLVGDLPLAARLPDLIATGAFVGLMLVGAAVVHSVLEAAVAMFRMANHASSLPAIERHVRMNVVLPAVLSQPMPEPHVREPRIVEPVAHPIAPVVGRRPATA